MTDWATTDAKMLLTLGAGEGKKMSDRADGAEAANAYSRLRLRMILFWLAALGVVCTLVANIVGQYVAHWLEPVVAEFGSALIVAAVIGGTVDLFLKDELARDAFVAAFRYILPEQLKEEVLRIISYKFICTESRTVFRLEPISGSDLVRVHISLQRTVKNVSREPLSIPVVFAVDEWGFSEKSKIEECSYDTGKGWVSCPDDTPRESPSIGKKQEITVAAGAKYKVVMKGYEIRRDNDAARLFHTTTAVNPIVELHLPEGFKHGCSFGVPSEKIDSSKIDSHYRLNGTQFPGQCTYIRWWRAA